MAHVYQFFISRDLMGSKNSQANSSGELTKRLGFKPHPSPWPKLKLPIPAGDSEGESM